jgi:predicted  nucleic acid-binding Zn-ribbon protein
MALWFSRDRSQATSLVTDDQRVEEDARSVTAGHLHAAADVPDDPPGDTPGGGPDAMGRISELLGELGLDAGEDPLAAAKRFLRTIDPVTADVPPTADAGDERPTVDATGAPSPREGPEAAAGADEALDVDIDLERADARAQRYHAQLEQLRVDLAAALAERDSAQRAVDAVREEFVPLRAEFAALQRSIDDNAAELAARTAERDAAIAARDSMKSALANAVEVTDELRVRAEDYLTDARVRIDELSRALDLANAEIVRLEQLLSAQEAERQALAVQLAAARGDIEELTGRLEGTQSALDALAAHAEDVEARLAAAARPDEQIYDPALVDAARATASAILDQARVDADALRQQAMREAEMIRRDAIVTADGMRRIAQEDSRELRRQLSEWAFYDGQRAERMSDMLDRVGRMERRLAKQQRRLERTIERLDGARKSERKSRRASRDELIALLARLVENA